jgi:adenosylcobyric acid synthase
MRKPLMIQGTMSNVGKSMVVAGICRVLHQDGYSVAPFKSQNMALNSWITDEGLEMARAQVVQAEAAGVTPSVLMNPILLKPTSDMGSQLIVMGEVVGTMPAAEYFEYRASLIPEIKRAYQSLADSHDIVVVEGAGSPAEINLRTNDIVNMGLAELIDAEVLLVGDIDPGGVFAQLIGTLVLLEDHERARVKGLIVNKFRGDYELWRPGVALLEERGGKPVVGTLPYLRIDIEDEDSLSSRFNAVPTASAVDVAVIRLPRISNFSDFAALEATAGIGLRYCDNPDALGNPDMVILPGTKNTIADLMWLRQVGLADAVLRLAGRGAIVFGLCGGYQMLGMEIRDPEGVEGGGEVAGLGLLPMVTEFMTEKTRTRVNGRVCGAQGLLEPMNGSFVEGYEIHMGVSWPVEGEAGGALLTKSDGLPDGCASGNVAGSYLHGFFDSVECRLALSQVLYGLKGIDAPASAFDFAAYKEEQYDILAAAVREHLDMGLIYELLGLGA